MKFQYDSNPVIFVGCNTSKIFNIYHGNSSGPPWLPRSMAAKSETDLGLGWWELPEHENYPVPRAQGSDG